MMFGLLASQLQYNDVIKPFIALSPVSFLGHSTTPLLFMTHFEPLYRYGFYLYAYLMFSLQIIPDIIIAFG